MRPMRRLRFGSCVVALPALAALAALTTTGCATPYSFGKTPGGLPPLSIDLRASEVTSTIGDAEGHRGQIATFLETLSEQKGVAPRPARFRAVVHGETHYGEYLLAVFYCMGYFGVLTNCAYTTLDRAVELELEVDGVRYSGAGFSSRNASTWFNASGYFSLKQATEDALRRGVTDGKYNAPPGDHNGNMP